MANKKYFVGIDLQKNELQNGVIHKLSTAPSSPSEGQIYYNDVDKELKVYNGTAWEAIGSDELTVANDSSAFVTITDGELHFNNLAITGVTVNTTETSLANFITSEYTVGNEFQEGDMVILTNATDQTKRSWIHNGGTAVNANDFTRLQTDLDMASVRAEFVGGDGITYTEATGTFDLTDNGVSTAKLAEGGVTAVKLNADVAGDAIELDATTNAINVKVDDIGIKIVDDKLTLDGANISEVLAGEGLIRDVVNNELDVNVDDSTLEISSDVVQIKDGGVTEAKLSSAVQTKLNNSYKTTIGDGATIIHTVTHSFNTKDVMAQIYDVSTGACIECDVVRNTVNTIQVTANPPIATNNARILITRID